MAKLYEIRTDEGSIGTFPVDLQILLDYNGGRIGARFFTEPPEPGEMLLSHLGHKDLKDKYVSYCAWRIVEVLQITPVKGFFNPRYGGIVIVEPYGQEWEMEAGVAELGALC